MGTEPHADAAYYVGFRVGDQAIGLDPNGHSKGQTGPVGYWEVDDIEQSVQRFWTPAPRRSRRSSMWVAAGRRRGGKDADGNIIGLMQSP